jgi:hypothetical protein
VDLRKRKLERWSALESQRSTWFMHWQDITRYLLPRSGRYFHTDRDRSSEVQYNEILDNTATRSLRVLGAGMMAGATSPARPWFRLKTEDPDLNDFHPVRVWLDDTRDRMMKTFAKANTYRALHTHYEELAGFGTSVSMLVGHHENVIHQYPSPVGEFCLAQSYDGTIDTLYRKFERTVAEVVREFGEDRVSERTRQLFDQKKFDLPVLMIHAIEPRTDRDVTMADSTNMAWESCYIELEAGDDGDGRGMLRNSGFRRFPVLAPRWGVLAGDVYGYSPGMESLGDNKQLQQEQMRKSQAIDYMTKPPLQVPNTLKDLDLEYFPGGIMPYDQVTPHGGVRNAFEVNLDIGPLLIDIEDVRQRIRGAFYADLFLMLAQAPPGRPQLTATEVAERHEEKLLQLGPVLERVHNELLKPVIDLTFEQMWEEGLLLPPPPDLAGQEVGVEFVSVLAQAQQAIGMNAVDRWASLMLAVAAGGKPEILDKMNADALADTSADRLGVDAELVVPDEEAQQLREARNAAIAAQEQAEMQKTQADTANSLANAPTSGDNALAGVIDNLSSL